MPKNKYAAAILAILLGGLGAHHFYLRQYGRALLYVLFCWTFIPVFISLIEAIFFLTAREWDFDQKYNADIY